MYSCMKITYVINEVIAIVYYCFSIFYYYSDIYLLNGEMVSTKQALKSDIRI